MRNLSVWILAGPFLWSLAPAPAVAADTFRVVPGVPSESCGAPVASLAVTDASQHLTLKGVTAPTVIPETKVSPAYSEAALKKGGRVALSCVVCRDGSVEMIQVMHSTTPEAAQAAAQALLKWKFNPAQKDGQAVAVTYSLIMVVKP